MERKQIHELNFTMRDFIQSIIDVYGEGREFTSAECAKNALPEYPRSYWSQDLPNPRGDQFFNRYTLRHDMRYLFNCREETVTIDKMFVDGTPKWYNPYIEVETYSDTKPAGKGWEMADDGKEPMSYTVKHWSLKDVKEAMAFLENYEEKKRARNKKRLAQHLHNAIATIKQCELAGYTREEVLELLNN